MSDDTPTINVTRGKRTRRSRSESSSSASGARSSGLNLPSPMGVVSGVIRGVRNAWWAGLGVLSVAQDAGVQVFEALVEEGKSWEQARRERTDETARQVRQLVEESDAIRAVEDRVRDEVTAVLQRVGVPHRDDVDALRERVDALSDEIDRLATSVEQTDA